MVLHAFCHVSSLSRCEILFQSQCNPTWAMKAIPNGSFASCFSYKTSAGPYVGTLLGYPAKSVSEVRINLRACLMRYEAVATLHCIATPPDRQVRYAVSYSTRIQQRVPCDGCAAADAGSSTEQRLVRSNFELFQP